MQKALLKCPKCEFEDGIVQTLAEVLPSGLISIRRSHRTFNGENETTLVIGQNFEILCGRCKTPIFRKILETYNIGSMILTHTNLQAMIGTP